MKAPAKHRNPDAAQKGIGSLKKQFNEFYNSRIVGGGFLRSDDYYRNEKRRYWRSLEFLSQIDLPTPATILEIGGGQVALLRQALYGDNCTVADISRRYIAPLQRHNVELVTFNLMAPDAAAFKRRFDLIYCYVP